MISFLARLKFLFTLLALLLMVQTSFAQINVTGNVTDEITGEALIGATVRTKGTTQGAITDIDGNYSLSVAADAVLVFSYVGYLEEEIPVNGQTVINAALAPSIEMLSEMVVIGYGVVKKSDLTGSVAVVTAEDLNRIPASTFTQAMQGRASGVTVTRSGSPGSNAKIQVRGIGSINRSGNPIYVIDGVITGSLNSVNPNDIESINILKDASASAIYGADGANGVIIITTKRGESGKPRVNYSNWVVLNQTPRQFELLNADEYAAFYSKIAEDAGNIPDRAYSNDFRQWYYGDGWQSGTDWQDEVVRNAFGHNHSLRISGGGEGSNYSISGNYYKEDGVLVNNSAERFNLRANSDFELGRYIKVGETFAVTRGITRSPTTATNPWSGTLIASPLMRVENPNNKGGYEGPQVTFPYPLPEFPDSVTDIANTGGNDKFNPLVSMMLSDNVSNSTNILASVYMEVKPVSWLTYKITPSVDANFNRLKNWIPAYESGVRSLPQASLTENFSEGINSALENQLTFNNTFGKHTVTATAVHQIRRFESNGINVTASGFPYENLNTIGMSYIDGREVGGFFTPFTAESYLGRIIYDYGSKYLLTASIRRDGNSRFGPENRWGNFPSLSLAWKVNEDFLQNVEEISMMKLRFGWGQTGNSDIGNFQYQSLLDPFSQFSPVFGVNQGLADALNVMGNTGNPSVQWEAAEMTNFGIDLNLLQDKIQLSAEYYVKTQDGLLVKYPLALFHGRLVGAADPFVNLGVIQNRGFEFTGNYRKMEGDFNYNITAVVTTLKNEVLDIPNSVITNANITQIGNTIGSFYGYVAERIITPADFDEEGNYLYAMPNTGAPSPGDLMFRDLNNDGAVSDLDRTVIGKPIPDLTTSLNIQLMYKNFDFAVFLYGMHRFDVYNSMRAGIEGFSAQDLDHNKLRDFGLNYYGSQVDGNGVPIPTGQLRLDPTNKNQNDRISTWYLETGSFLRVKDLQLGYTLPSRVSASIGISSARIYVSAMNLYTYTQYKGRDPEAPVSGTNNLSIGSDGGTYPVPRAFTAGVQVDI